VAAATRALTNLHSAAIRIARLLITTTTEVIKVAAIRNRGRTIPRNRGHILRRGLTRRRAAVIRHRAVGTPRQAVTLVEGLAVVVLARAAVMAEGAVPSAAVAAQALAVEEVPVTEAEALRTAATN